MVPNGDFRDPDVVFRRLTRKHHLPSKGANQLLREIQHYEIDDRGLLVRIKYASLEDMSPQRTVIPVGGIHAFHWQGRKYRMSARKALLLIANDNPATRGHL